MCYILQVVGAYIAPIAQQLHLTTRAASGRAKEKLLPKSKLTEANRKAVLADIRKCQELHSEGKLKEGRDLAEGMADYAKRMGVQSAHLLWVRAILADYAGDHEPALIHILAAAATDPLDPNIARSEGIILDRARTALGAPDRDLDDPATPRIHKLLVKAGASDDACHLALAAHLNFKGKPAQALAVVDAVLTLSPTNQAAWSLKAVISRKVGDNEAALTADAEAAACVPCSIPSFDGAVVAQA